MSDPSDKPNEGQAWPWSTTSLSNTIPVRTGFNTTYLDSSSR